MLRILLTTVAVLGLLQTSYAQTPLFDLSASPDSALDLNGTVIEDHQTALNDLGGTITLQTFASVSENADLVAFERASNGSLLSFDIFVTLPTTSTDITVRPADVVRFDGSDYTLVFDATAAGIPNGVRVDAVATDGSDLLLSFDTTVDLGSGLTVTDEDLVRWDGVSFTLFLATSTVGIDPALDLDGAHRLKDGNLLLSFDGSGSVGTPAVFFDDEDILEYDPAGSTWELAYDGSAQATAWLDGSDIDAFDVTEPLIIDSSLQISGSALGGTIFFTVADVPLSIVTTNGLTPAQLAQAMADAINADPTLSGLGVTAIAVGDTLYTNGALTQISTTDTGLTLVQGLSLPPQPDGDINLDGAVNAADILIGQQVLGGTATLTPLQLIHGDVAPLVSGTPAPDGLFTLGDLLVIQRKVLGVISF
jgi:hypothetical protein